MTSNCYIDIIIFSMITVYLGSSSGVHIILGLKRTTGTLLKCSIGMFILVKHLVQTVRLQRVHRCPQGPKIPNLNCHHNQKISKFSTQQYLPGFKTEKTHFSTFDIVSNSTFCRQSLNFSFREHSSDMYDFSQGQ